MPATQAFASHPRVDSLDPGGFQARLADGLGLRIGPFDVHIKARATALAEPLYRLYGHYPLLDDARVFSCHLRLEELRAALPKSVRRVRFTVDGRQPHDDMPAEQALAVLEWGFNLVIALRFHRFLMLHSAVLERNGGALLMPAGPGHGKTTLCAALAHRGWRLLSDEFGLLRPGKTAFVPIPRPMPLKNASIEVMRNFAPQAELGPSIEGTIKGTVAHVRPPRDSVDAAAIEAPARWVVFPRWQADARLSFEEVPRAEAFMSLARNAFNYEVVGQAAFETVRDIVDRSRCYRLVYSDLDEAVELFDRLARGVGAEVESSDGESQALPVAGEGR
ncbi:MAG TPA: HprK-related kinase A [Burkholderiaceae bacterium]|nr:HprK-related kinase A [Burkholderiaceae bacterium]